jgi:hypothetical protein
MPFDISELTIVTGPLILGTDVRYLSILRKSDPGSVADTVSPFIYELPSENISSNDVVPIVEKLGPLPTYKLLSSKRKAWPVETCTFKPTPVPKN